MIKECESLLLHRADESIVKPPLSGSSQPNRDPDAAVLAAPAPRLRRVSLRAELNLPW